jgi:hypothetical protein
VPAEADNRWFAGVAGAGDSREFGVGRLPWVLQNPAGHTLFGPAQVRETLFNLSQHLAKLQKSSRESYKFSCIWVFS